MKRLLGILLLALCGHAAAATYYVSNCGTGAMAGCTNGADTNAGTVSTSPKQTAAAAATLYNACAAGDTILFAQGGSWQVTTDLTNLSCTSSTAANPVTIGEYAPSWVSACTGSGTATATSSTTLSTGLAPALNAWAGCEVKVTSSVAGSTYTQRFRIASNTTAGVLTLATYTAGDLTPTSTWEYTPSTGDAFSIVGPAPVFTDSGVNDKIMSFLDAGTFDHHGIVVKGLHLDGGMFARNVTSATNATNAVITDSGLGATANQYLNRSLMISAGTCYNGNNQYIVSANTATTITLTGLIYSDFAKTIPCTPDATSRYAMLGANFGMFFYKLNSDVVLDGLQVTGMQIGIDCAGSNSVPTARNWVVKNSQIKRNEMGMLWECDNSTIEANYFAHNGLTLGDHHLYISDTRNAPGTLQTYVRGNRFSNADIGPAGQCTGSALIKHGRGNGIFIENNFLHEDVAPTANCWGIAVDSGGYSDEGEGFTNVILRGNTVVGFPQAMGVDIVNYALIENNNIYQPNGIGIRFRDKVFESIGGYHVGYTVPANVTVRNNTINLTAPDLNAVGIQMSANASDPASLGGHKVYSNIILLGSSATTSTKCFDTSNLVAANFAGFDYNTCYTTSASTPISGAPSGLNTNGNTTNPGVTVGAAPNYPMTITSGSAAYNTGSPSNSSPYAIGGYKRSGTGAPSKGAFEPNATIVLPGTPTKIQIQ